jgi:hypothetical protein
MLIFKNNDDCFEIEVKELENVMRIFHECDCGCGETTFFDVTHRDYEDLIQSGIIDYVDVEDEEYCECPYCRIESQIEELNLYLHEAIRECAFEEVKDITASIKNLLEIRELI